MYDIPILVLTDHYPFHYLQHYHCR